MYTQPVASKPLSQKWLVDGFCWYGKKMIRKRFSSFGISNVAALHSIPSSTGLVVYLNHASWWDPIIGMLLNQRYCSDRTLYAPIDAVQLENYSVMKKMGFFGVELQSYSGAQNFLLTSKAILSSPSSALWLTPEGRFCDVRDASQPLMPGLSHLASKVSDVTFVPVAVEYAFWDDALPHVFCRIGAPVCYEDFDDTSSTVHKSRWDIKLTEGLRTTQRELAELVIQRNADAFEYLIASKPQRLGLYDHARSWAAWMRGKSFDPRHSAAVKKATP